MHKDIVHYRDTKKIHVSIVQNFNENEASYSKSQLKNYRLSREIYTKVGHPSQKYFNKLIKSNLISNFPVNLWVANWDEKIYTPNLLSFKGKPTCKNQDPVVKDYITVPKEIFNSNKNIPISADIVFFNKIPLFVAISRNIKFAIIKMYNQQYYEEAH